MKWGKTLEVVTHTAFWLLFLIFSINMSAQFFGFATAFWLGLKSTLLLAGVAYINAFYIIPHFFKKGRFGYYVLAIAVLLVVVIIISYLSRQYLLPEPPRRNLPFPRPERPIRPMGFFRFGIAPTFFTSILVLFISTSYQLAREFIRKERRSSLLEKEKVENELKFLRSQINPHFLFNSLNNLHATVQLAPEKAGNYILKLGEMLRYVFEDCKRDKVKLTDEIRYIESYIFFQKQKDEQLQNISFTVSGDDPARYTIEPMLLIALVENAFVHSYAEDTRQQYIDIHIQLKQGIFQFTICNNLPRDQQPYAVAERKQPGLGLSNVRRRLELLYPGDYGFSHGATGTEYFTRLTIKKMK